MEERTYRPIDSVPVTLEDVRPQQGRSGLLKAGAALATTALLLAGCGGSEQDDANPDQHNEVGVYVPNWNTVGSQADEDQFYKDAAEQTTPGEITRLYYSFAIPHPDGTVDVDVLPPESPKLAYIKKLVGDNTELSLTIGGYGDDTASPTELYSRPSVLAGWETALKDPKRFAVQALAARKRLADSVGVDPETVGFDIDFEYPRKDQKEAFVTLLEVLDPDVDHLTVAIPSPGDNLKQGFDLPKISEIVDGVNAMTYANGPSYSPDDVAQDVEALEGVFGDKLVVGLSTDPTENPLISSPKAFADIRKKVEAVTGKPNNHYMVWQSGGLTTEHREALQTQKAS